MLGAFMIAAALTAPVQDPLAQAMEHFRALDTYRVTVRAIHQKGEDSLRYFYRKPGSVRIEFIRPHAGAVLIYDPATRLVWLWPFGQERFPRLALSPDNPLVRNDRGQRVDRSDVGALLHNVDALRRQGKLATAEEALDGQPALLLDVVGDGNAAVAGVHRYRLWLERETLFPRKVESFDRQGTLIETVYLEDAEIDLPLSPALFEPGP